MSPIDGRAASKSIDYGLDKSERRKEMARKLSKWQTKERERKDSILKSARVDT